MMKIAIIDYEVGNLANVYNAWKRLGIEAAITRDPAVIRDADLVELPGVGAIRDAMGNLQKFDLIPLLQEQVQSGKFFMGVCLGMQALFEKSYEGGTYDCLGFLPGDIVPFHTKLKVPHMGWNELEFRQEHWLQKGLPAHPYVYFVHSYHKGNDGLQHLYPCIRRTGKCVCLPVPSGKERPRRRTAPPERRRLRHEERVRL